MTKLRNFSSDWLEYLRQKRPGEIVGMSVTSNFANTVLSTTLPVANATYPTITQGTQVFDVNYTPKQIGNKIVVEVSVTGGELTNIGDMFSSALFINNATTCVAMDMSKQTDVSTGNNGGRTHILYDFDASSLSAINFKVRAGLNNGSSTLNAVPIYNANNSYPAGIGSWIKITEIQA